MMRFFGDTSSEGCGGRGWYLRNHYGHPSGASRTQKVALFEREGDILLAASHVNQYRLHRGFHYPRSPETIRECLQAERTFREEYGQAVIDGGIQVYAIARENSRTSPERFRQVLQEHGLEFELWSDPDVRADAVGALFRVREGRLDYARLKAICGDRIRSSGVELHLNHPFVRRDEAGYDQIILAMYAGINSPPVDGQEPLLCQFEVCEKPVVRLPSRMAEKSIVVLDGPFMCVDPAGRTEHHVLGNVVHAIHCTNVGYHPDVPRHIARLLNRGIVPSPPCSRFERFIEAGSHFIPVLREASWVGSMFTVRAVLPDVDETDERPTIVRRLTDRHIRVFSGKFGSCVDAAREVVSLVDEAA